MSEEKKFRKRDQLICGIGINDADYHVHKTIGINGKRKIVWVCPFYTIWHSMLVRCYDLKFQERNPTYQQCSCAPEWLLFSEFKAWMEQQDWQGNQLDKDLLVRGNKVYGPETCIFVSPKINGFLTERLALRGDYPIGVHFEKKRNRYKANCWSVELNKNKSLGYYKTPEEAHKAWLAFKLEQAKILAAMQTDERVASALLFRYENYVII